MSKEGFVNVDGLQLHYIDWEGSGKTIILLTGLGATAKYYGSFASNLAKRFRVLALTRRGHGRSQWSNADINITLDVLVNDIIRFLDVVEIDKAIFVGHSMAGYEMTQLALLYPQRVEALVFLDAIYPTLDSQPDFSDAPLHLLPSIESTDVDFSSMDAYFNYQKRSRPDWARIWCKEIEEDLLESVKVLDNGRIEDTSNGELLERMWNNVQSNLLEYQNVTCPMLVVMPVGDYYPGLPLDSSDETKLIINNYWNNKFLEWIKEKIRTFRRLAPSSRIVELDSPNHRIFMAKEAETVQAIFDFIQN
jgi:pimeloyl-ACP methyl ester carboxylesterase